MKAGRYLDKLIAEKVMGLDVSKLKGRGYSCQICGSDDYAWKRGEPIDQIPPYSSSIEAAWEVVGKLEHTLPSLTEEPHGWVFTLLCEGLCSDGTRTKQSTAFAPTAPLAICLAALTAVENTGD